MDPELAIFLSRPLAMEFFTQDDQMVILACQMTIQMVRLEEEQRRLRAQDQLLPEIAPPQPICAVCLDSVVPGLAVQSSVCGHYLCRICSLRMDGVLCAFCRGPWEPAYLRDVNFRFNTRGSIICRACSTEFVEESEILLLQCGDCFCRTCCDRLSNYCICGHPKMGQIRLLLNY